MPSFFKNQILILSSFLLLNSFVQAGQPMWTVEPVAGSNPKQVIQDGASATINYLVTNYSLKNKQLQMLAIPGVQSNGPCLLAPRGHAGSQCTLSLTINGSQIPKNGIHNGPILCQVNSNGVPNAQQCYRPSAGNELDIIRSSGSQTKHVTVGGYSDALGGVYPLAYYSVDSGQSWALSQVSGLPNGMILRSVSCDRAVNHCVAVAANTDTENLITAAVTSEDGGKSWVSSLPILPYQGYMTELTSVACDAEGVVCIAAGGYKINASDQYTFPVTYTSADGGNNWIVSSVPSPLGDGGSIADMYCNKSASQCIAVGSYHDIEDRPIIYFSNDSGATWSIPTLPPVSSGENFGLLSVSCNQNELTCLAVGLLEPFNAFISTDGGQTWTSSNTPAPINGDNFSFISCDPNNAPCVLAVGEKEGAFSPINYLSNNSMQSWSGPYTISPSLGQIIQSLSCREGKCIIVGITLDSSFWVRHSQDNGVTWNSSLINPPGSAVFSLLSSVF